MPIVVQERIVSYLDNVTLVKLSRVNHHLHSLCLNKKFWEKINIEISVLLLKFESCEKLVLRYEDVLKDFKIQYDEEDDRGTIKKYQNDLDFYLRRLLYILPKSLIRLRLPIYLLQNATSGKRSKAV